MSDLVTIEMTTIQEVDGEKDTTTVSYHGRCSIKNDFAVLQYMTEDEAGKTVNKMELSEARCFLESKGDIQRQMEFVPGKRTTSRMRLPMGIMEMDVVTKQYQMEVIKEEPKHMHVVLAYDLYSGNVLVAHNNLDMKISARV